MGQNLVHIILDNHMRINASMEQSTVVETTSRLFLLLEVLCMNETSNCHLIKAVCENLDENELEWCWDKIMFSYSLTSVLYE
jgi:hypothetical protein